MRRPSRLFFVSAVLVVVLTFVFGAYLADTGDLSTEKILAMFGDPWGDS
jgi:hypothetical protein